MFEEGNTSPLPTLPVILLEQETLESDDIYLLPESLVEFVNFAVHTAQYRRDELPKEAFECFHVDYYIAQVNNGGHSQYVGNSGWHDYQIADIRAGLAAIGDEEAIELYEDLCAYADSNPKEFQDGMVSGGFGDIPDFFQKADDAFFELGLGERLMRGDRDRIRELDCVMAFPFMECRRIVKQLPMRNPNYEARSKPPQQEPPKRSSSRWKWPWSR